MGSGDGRLGELRAAIDATDDELLEVLNRRARLVEDVAKHKQSSGRAFYVPGRERAIIDRLKDANAGPFPNEAIRPVFQEVISACLSLEKGVRIAYLGPEGTFTHQAVKRHFGTSAASFPCGSIDRVFREVAGGQVDFGVVPVENSSEGVVNHTLDSFIDSDLTIADEIVVTVDLCLLARPGVNESHIERLYSHPNPLGQCREWIRENLPRATIVECPSTTDAARQAKDDSKGAAIAAELAAKIYGLAVLRQRLQDYAHNVTRFLVIKQGGAGAADEGAEYKTSVLLVLGNKPGDLYAALRPLSEGGINLTKIESRPSRNKAWEYVFFVDLQGHVADSGIATAIEQLGEVCDVKVLGSYRTADSV
jgi:chorismate mutase/prephenate dehydratase